MNSLANLEGKIDELGVQSLLTTEQRYGQFFGTVGASAIPISVQATTQNSAGTSIHFSDPSTLSAISSSEYKYVAAAHKSFVWPAFRQAMESFQPRMSLINLSTLEEEAPSIILGISEACSTFDVADANQKYAGRPVLLFDTDSNFSVESPVPRLSWEIMEKLAKQYFDTFNLIYPILNRQTFISETLPAVFNNSLGNNIYSTLAWLVFALGELAGDRGYFHTPTDAFKGYSNGTRGGMLERPSGLSFFNEARKRIGFNLVESSLESVQVYSLAA